MGEIQNQFYQAFDMECLTPRQNPDYRTPFQRDRDRIIHSSAFRRLQAKTQVFLSGEYDFYRTRLTHSIEVAQIGRSICNYLKETSNDLHDDFYIDPDLVEAASLAHDLGHPPFGHSGEKILNELMGEFGGFEGNAQTLHLLTEAIHNSGVKRVGMKPTRGLLDGVLKYKTLRRQLDNAVNHFLYDSQSVYLDFVFDKMAFPESLTPGQTLNHFRAVECQIMDWADDTAYSLNDIIDGYNARLISRSRLESWGAEQSLTQNEDLWLSAMISATIEGNVTRTFSRKIGHFIEACRLEQRKNFMSGKTHRYGYALILDEQKYHEACFYKRVASDLVFDAPQLLQLRHKWENLLRRFFRTLLDNYNSSQPEKLVNEDAHRNIVANDDEKSRMRLICDYIAGMTDAYLIRSYRRLFDPNFGSIIDLV